MTPIHHICNISLKAGIFPNNMKIAKVNPLFQSDAEEKIKKTTVLYRFYQYFQKC